MTTVLEKLRERFTQRSQSAIADLFALVDALARDAEPDLAPERVEAVLAERGLSVDQLELLVSQQR